MKVSLRFGAALLACLCLSHWVSSSASPAADGVLIYGETDAISQRFLLPLRSDFVTPDELDLQYEQLTIENENGEQLRAWFISRFLSSGATQETPVAKQTVLFCMGNQGNISTHLAYAKLLVEGGFNVLMFDYQGYGGSSGKATALSLYGDACRATEYLIHQRQIASKDIGSFGVSLGSMLAVAVASKYELGAVAVEDILLPNKKLDEISQFLPNDFASKIAIGTVRNVLLPQVDPLLNAKKMQCPLLIMHGENDSLLSPTGAIDLARAANRPPRVWIMDDAGHAPETLEIYDGEYGQQLETFFQQAFAGSFSQPKLEMTVTPQADNWQAEIAVECTEAGCYQVVLTSEEGLCHFLRPRIDDKVLLTEVVPFEPKHVSALKIYNTEELDRSQWKQAKSDRSRSLQEFRDFTANFVVACPLPQRMAINGMLRQISWERDPGDLQWLAEHLPAPASVHPDVRPRYARLIAQCFAQLPAKEQLAHVAFIERLLPYLPAEPDRYYQLENASFQLQLRDEQLAGTVIMLAKHKFDQGQLEEARSCLRTAFKLTNQRWPTLEKIDQLQLDADFYHSIGSPYHAMKK